MVYSAPDRVKEKHGYSDTFVYHCDRSPLTANMELTPCYSGDTVDNRRLQHVADNLPAGLKERNPTIRPGYSRN